MEEKLRNFVVAAQIVAQLPDGDIKEVAIEELFGNSLAELGLPDGSYIYRRLSANDAKIHQFVVDGGEGCEVVINSLTKNGESIFNIVADIS